ncbi:hypothetical protein ACROYT_G011928 [Oculina patagonica]
MAKPSATASCETRFHRLNKFITLHGSELPQIVKVGKGFNGTSVDQSIETEEILIIFKVEREKKILARQLSSGRRFCFPKTSDLKVELVSDPSQDVYGTLDAVVKVPSRYARVLENISSFGLLAGDVLKLSPYSNECHVRCLIVSLKDPVYVDLPVRVEGKFQALSNYLTCYTRRTHRVICPAVFRELNLKQGTKNRELTCKASLWYSWKTTSVKTSPLKPARKPDKEKNTRGKSTIGHPLQSDDFNEENNNSDNLDLDYPEEFSDGYHSNVQYGRQGSAETTERDGQGELKSPGGSTEGDQCRTNGDNPKKKFFHSLTRKPRWFRQDSSKPAKKDKTQTLKTKSRNVKIPPRHAASCEDILISSPREDDFECMTSITKYLETQEKLAKALVHISRLQNQGQKDVEKTSKPEGNTEFANAQEKSSNESVKAWQRKESEVETQGSQTRDKTLPFTPANTPEDSELSGLPAPHFLALKQSATTWQNQNLREQGKSENRRGETNGRRLGMFIEGPVRAATDANDSESMFPPSYSFQRDNGPDSGTREIEGRSREPRHEDFNKTCPYCRYHFSDTFSEELSESAAKNELKKAILQTNWSEDEWMELTEIVNRKIRDIKRIRVPYVNWAAPHESPENLPMDLTTVESSRYPKSNEDGRRLGMPPYVNIDQGSWRPATPPYQNIARDPTQASPYNVQRLASRSQGKPPIPTPRGERSSI